MADAADNSPTARAHRYDRDHARRLRALAYRMLGSRAEAEDVVQEAWLRWAPRSMNLRSSMPAHSSRAW